MDAMPILLFALNNKLLVVGVVVCGGGPWLFFTFVRFKYRHVIIVGCVRHRRAGISSHEISTLITSIRGILLPSHTYLHGALSPHPQPELFPNFPDEILNFILGVSV